METPRDRDRDRQPHAAERTQPSHAERAQPHAERVPHAAAAAATIPVGKTWSVVLEFHDEYDEELGPAEQTFPGTVAVVDPAIASAATELTGERQVMVHITALAVGETVVQYHNGPVSTELPVKTIIRVAKSVVVDTTKKLLS